MSADLHEFLELQPRSRPLQRRLFEYVESQKIGAQAPETRALENAKRERDAARAEEANSRPSGNKRNRARMTTRRRWRPQKSCWARTSQGPRRRRQGRHRDFRKNSADAVRAAHARGQDEIDPGCTRIWSACSGREKLIDERAFKIRFRDGSIRRLNFSCAAKVRVAVKGPNGSGKRRCSGSARHVFETR